MAASVPAKTFSATIAGRFIRPGRLFVPTGVRFRQRLLPVVGGLFSLWFLTGCHSNKVVAQTELPFDRVWVKPAIQHQNYTKLIVRPVNTEYLLKSGGWLAANPTHRELGPSAQDLATFTRETFINTIAHDPKHRFGLVGWEGPDVATLELAVVELTPDPAILKALDLKPPAAAPGKETRNGEGRPSVTIEGRVRDSVTGEVLMLFTDREVTSMKAFDLKELTWWACARESIRKWAKAYVDMPTGAAEGHPELRLQAW